MVRREGTRFGVSTGHSVKRQPVTAHHLHSSQNIVVHAVADVKVKRTAKQASAVVEKHLQNRSLNLKGFNQESTLQFSLNKSKRWEVMDQLKEDVGHFCSLGNRIVVAERHIGVGRPGDEGCTGVFDSMSEKSRIVPRKTYAKAKDLIAKETKAPTQANPDEIGMIEEDKEFGKKNRKRKQRKKVKVDKKKGAQIDAYTVNVSYDVNVVAPRRTIHTYPKRERTDEITDMEGDAVIQSSRRGTKKRNKKPVRDMWEDMLQPGYEESEEDSIYDYLCNLPDEEDFDSRYFAYQPSLPQSKVGNVLGMFIKQEVGQSQISKPKMREFVDDGFTSNTKERVFQVENSDREPTATSTAQGNAIEVVENACLQISLPAKALERETLEGHFGSKYQEARSYPRRFSVDITSQIMHELKQSHKCNGEMIELLLSTSYQVFAVFCPTNQPSEQGMVEVTMTVVGERFNTMDSMKLVYGCPESHSVPDLMGNIVKRLAFQAADRCQVESSAAHQRVSKIPTGLSLETVETSLHLTYRIISSQQLTQELETAKCKSDNTGSLTAVSIQHTVKSCGICYEELSERCAGTCLLACNHFFCDQCWKDYVLTKISQGQANIRCPGFKCQSVVDAATLMWFVPNSHWGIHLKQKLNFTVATEKQLMWCPKAVCGRLVRLGVSDHGTMYHGISVACECGALWCSKCKQDAHFPATCKMASSYFQEKKFALASIMTWKEAYVDMVRYKPCPQCSYPIQRIIGCNFMVCPCECRFCWACGTAYGDSGQHACEKPKEYEIFEFVEPLTRLCYEQAILHHYHRSRSHSMRRKEKAIELAKSLAVALFQEKLCEDTSPSALDPTPSATPLPSGSHTPKPVAFHRMMEEEAWAKFLTETSADFRRASDFLMEMDFVLEFGEVLCANLPPSDLKPCLVQKKCRLAFIAHQLDEILTMNVQLDKRECVKRVNSLYHQGKNNLAWFTKQVADLEQFTASKKEAQEEEDN